MAETSGVVQVIEALGQHAPKIATYFTAAGGMLIAFSRVLKYFASLLTARSTAQAEAARVETEAEIAEQDSEAKLRADIYRLLEERKADAEDLRERVVVLTVALRDSEDSHLRCRSELAAANRRIDDLDYQVRRVNDELARLRVKG